jgi:hypothetical protein
VWRPVAAACCLAWLEFPAFVGPNDAFLRICPELAVAVKGSYAAIPTWRYVDPTTYDMSFLAHELRCMCMPLYTGTISFNEWIESRDAVHCSPKQAVRMLGFYATKELQDAPCAFHSSIVCCRHWQQGLLGLNICCLRYAVIH